MIQTKVGAVEGGLATGQAGGYDQPQEEDGQQLERPQEQTEGKGPSQPPRAQQVVSPVAEAALAAPDEGPDYGEGEEHGRPSTHQKVPEGHGQIVPLPEAVGVRRLGGQARTRGHQRQYQLEVLHESPPTWDVPPGCLPPSPGPPRLMFVFMPVVLISTGGVESYPEPAGGRGLEDQVHHLAGSYVLGEVVAVEVELPSLVGTYL